MKPIYNEVEPIAQAILDQGEVGYQQLKAYIEGKSPRTKVDVTCDRDMDFSYEHGAAFFGLHLHTEKGVIYLEHRHQNDRSPDKRMKHGSRLFHRPNYDQFPMALYSHLLNVMG